MEQLCSAQQVSSTESSSWSQAPGKQSVAGFEKIDHIKTTQAGCKWARVKAVGSRMGNGGSRMRHKANRAQTRHFDSTYLHIALSHSGVLWDSWACPPTHWPSVTDSYLHWLTPRELGACWEVALARLIDHLPALSWLALNVTNTILLNRMKCAEYCWKVRQRCTNWSSYLEVKRKHVHIEPQQLPPRVWRVFPCRYK